MPHSMPASRAASPSRTGSSTGWRSSIRDSRRPARTSTRYIDPTYEHPLPIILLNGTTATQGTNWGVGAPVLANAGYKVYTFNYGNVTGNPNSPIQATADIRRVG